MYVKKGLKGIIFGAVGGAMVITPFVEDTILFLLICFCTCPKSAD